MFYYVNLGLPQTKIFLKIGLKSLWFGFKYMSMNNFVPPKFFFLYNSQSYQKKVLSLSYLKHFLTENLALIKEKYFFNSNIKLIFFVEFWIILNKILDNG